MLAALSTLKFRIGGIERGLGQIKVGQGLNAYSILWHNGGLLWLDLNAVRLPLNAR